MDPQPLLTESKHYSKKSLSQRSHRLKIHADEPCSKEDHLNQPKETLFDQSMKVPFTADLELEESTTILKKVKDIDEKFEEGWIYVYDFWLSVVIALAVGKNVLLAVSMKNSLLEGEYEMVKVSAIPLILAFFSLLWLIRQVLLHKEALKKKDAKIAAQAYSSLVRAMICSFILSVIFFLTIIFGRSFYSGSKEDKNDWIGELYNFVLRFITYCVVPAGISVYGSYKVKVVLEERMNLLKTIPHKIDTEPSLQTESNVPFQDYPCSKVDHPDQLNKSQLDQPTQIPSKIESRLKESETVLKKVKDIDRSLTEGSFFAYELWIYITIILALSKGVFMCGWMSGAFYMRRKGGQTWIIAFSILLIFALYYIYWSVRQALLHKKAMKKKDPQIAAQAYNSVVRLSIHYFILCVIFFIVGTYVGFYRFKFTDSWEDLLFDICYPIFQFVSHYAIPVPITIYGSYKLKNVLEERRRLIEEADLPQSSFLLDPLSKKSEELHRGWLFSVYKIWLYLTPVLGIYLYGKFYKSDEFYYDHLWDKEEDRSSIFLWAPRGYALHCLVWLVRQAWNELIAIRQRDLKMATKAYNSVVWLARYYSIWVLLKLLDSAISMQICLEEGGMSYEVGRLICFSMRLIEFYFVPVGICIYGSKQVKNLLKEKEKLIQKTHNNHADSS